MAEQYDRDQVIAELTQLLRVAELQVRVFGRDFGLEQFPEHVEAMSAKLELTQRILIAQKLAQAAFGIWFIRWRFGPLATKNDTGPLAFQELCVGLGVIGVPAVFHNILPVHEPSERAVYDVVFGGLTLAEVATKDLLEIQQMFRGVGKPAKTVMTYFFDGVCSLGFLIHDPSRDARLVQG